MGLPDGAWLTGMVEPGPEGPWPAGTGKKVKDSHARAAYPMYPGLFATGLPIQRREHPIMKAHQAHARPQPVQRERETQASRPGWLARNRRTGSPGVRRGALIVVILACLSFAFAASAQTPPPQSFPDLDLVKGGSIQAVAHQPDGGIVIGGTFTRVHGVPRSNIARLHPDGTLDMDWNPDADGAVQALAVDVDGAVFVGGSFANIGGQTRRFVAKLAGAGTGTAAPDWAPTANNAVEALALDENGDLYIGGSFSLIDQQPRQRIARIAANGVLDPDWNPGANSRVATLALAPGPGGTLYAGGAFTHIGGMERNRIARLSRNGTGAVDPDWNPSANGPVLAMAVDDSGAVYAGGSFGQVNGEPRQRSTLDQLIWDVPEILHELSKLYALRAGDLVFMGTPAGVAALHPGDACIARLDGLLELHCQVHAPVA